MNDTLEGGRFAWMTVSRVSYVGPNRRVYKRFTRNIGDDSFTESNLIDEEWETSPKKKDWYELFLQVEEDKQRSEFNREFGIEIS